MQPLPIDPLLPHILTSLTSSSGAVILAPPGSGKTSRLPLALLKSELAQSGSILMLEPRRLAAVNAASWLARCLGEEVGATVGYSIRFDRNVSSATRLEVLTEGLLTRRLQSDPTLDGISVVIFDEFHERTIHADTAMAFCIDIQKTIRPDLKIIVMSATLDCEPVAKLLGGVPVFSCEGRAYPVDIRYLGDSSGDIARSVAGSVIRALHETAGDILVFLPGAGEIRRCHTILNESVPKEILLCQLYSDLPFSVQERAIRPASRRKVVLSTNIAETSLTIEGVSVVIDAGLTRIVRFDPSTGLNRLQTVRVSASSALQRTGRGGRLGPGTCYRLWSAETDYALLPFNPPEIRVVDLAPLALELANWGVADLDSLSWLDAPSPQSLHEAWTLLIGLGAVDSSHRITNHGRRMALLPLHPRLASMLLEGEALGVSRIACDLAALLSERDIFRRSDRADRQASNCDFSDRLDALYEWRSGSGIPALLDLDAARQVDRVAGRLKKFLSHDTAGPPALDSVPLLLMKAFPDRIGLQREIGSDRYLLANGTGARLAMVTALHDQKFIVAVEVSGGAGREGLIYAASAVTAEQIRHLFAGQITVERKTVLDRDSGRIVSTVEERFGALRLAARNVAASDDDAANALIQALQGHAGLDMLPWTTAARQFQARVQFLSRIAPDRGFPDLGNAALSSTLPERIAPFLNGMRSLADLNRLNISGLLQSFFTWEQVRQIDEGAPTHITVPSGSRIPIDYRESEPVISVKLQEMFGLAETPLIAWGRVPLLVQLLSPARRPIQVTTDLHSFWQTTYAQVKKELKGRYPKHPWPDDPWSAVPTRRTKRSV